MSDWVSIDALLLARIGEGTEESRRRAGGAMKCGPGCFSCCLGPFPITEADAIRLRSGLSLQPAEARHSIVSRAREAAERLPQREAGDWLFDREWQMIPCPALELEEGVCRLYEHRPAACRTYGPALVLDGVALTPCPLNYEGWTAEQVEAARVPLTTADLAATVVTAMGAGGGRTTIAHALLQSAMDCGE